MTTQPSNQLHSLTYMSTALRLLPKNTYKEIASFSHTYNETANITGLLLIYNGLIMQIIEGKETEIESLYERIALDKRHKNPQVLIRRAIEQRDFPNWAMGYKNLDASDNKNWAFRLSPSSFTKCVPASISGVSRDLLTSFKRTSGLVYI
jgi:hypothetical protein